MSSRRSCAGWTSSRSCNPALSDGRQRRYSRHEIALAQHVSQMADAGMSLAGIRRILELEAEVAALHAQIATLQSVAAKS